MNYTNDQILNDDMQMHGKFDERNSVSIQAKSANEGDMASRGLPEAAADSSEDAGPSRGNLITALLYFATGAGAFLSLAWCALLFLLLVKAVIFLISYYKT